MSFLFSCGAVIGRVVRYVKTIGCYSEMRLAGKTIFGYCEGRTNTKDACRNCYRWIRFKF